MRRAFTLALFIVVGAFALAPLAHFSGGGALPWLTPRILAGLNLTAWCVVLAFILRRILLRRSVENVAKNAGIDSRFRSLEQLINDVIREVSRKNSSLSINLIERRITSREELSRTLERIVALAFKLLDAESAELALFDKDSGLYHSSFVLGKPFRLSAQEMLAGGSAAERDSIEVLVHPIAFAGAVLGGLRVGLKRGSVPSLGDREIMRLLAVQSSLAIINSKYTAELMRMKQFAEESVKAKTGFLANLSHELRGPLGIMLNAVELVLEGLCGPVTADQLETLGMVRGNGEHLLDLINDVLDYAKIESGRIKPEPASLPANETLEDLCAVVRTQAHAKNHKIVFTPCDEALAFTCDRRHVRQMLINMLTNAIKYTPDGGTIEVWAERIPGSKVKLNVKDSGVGIDETNRAKVFAPFERIEQAYSINQVGAGLGMPLTKRLAEMNGGLIDFSSQAGKGSHFWLIFNAAQYEPAALSSEAGAPAERPGKGETIVFLARSDGERSLVARHLSHAGFTVVAVSTPDEAVEALHGKTVGLALIDNDIIDQSTEDVLGRLHTAAGAAPLPTVLVSSRAFVFDIENYLRLGVDRCLSKPLDMRELARSCREVIDTKTALARPHGAKAGRSETPAVTRRSGSDDIFH